MNPTRQQLRDEQRRVNQLKRQGWTNDGPSDRNLKGWLRGWRVVGSRVQAKRGTA